MKRAYSVCLLALALAACASRPPKADLPLGTVAAPKPGHHGHKAAPAAAAPETRQTRPPLDLAPVPFAQARAAFVRDTAARYGIDPSVIQATLARAKVLDSVIAAMSRPAERVKPWSEYRPLFITQTRIDGGRRFMDAHRGELMRVQARTGVPAEVIVAVIGVETSYGANTGCCKVLDALYTLAFDYPRSGDPARAEREVRRELFFRDELAQLFALGKEEGFDVAALTGSYAGAMGLGQFMPSSYRQYAVDGDGDGKRNLFTDHDDAFASIANYFVKKGGWQPGGEVVARARLAEGHEAFNPSDWTPTWTLGELARRGYHAVDPVQAGARATPISLEGADGTQYWLGFRNYYAITRYNNSRMYAMAVYQLSQAIAGKEIPAT